ncbi:MAG: hypothetical protein KBS47_01250 [Bacteroidales bacterium]|nr:hypothetical protein [Candidatus Equimonas enterica]
MKRKALPSLSAACSSDAPQTAYAQTAPYFLAGIIALSLRTKNADGGTG